MRNEFEKHKYKSLSAVLNEVCSSYINVDADEMKKATDMVMSVSFTIHKRTIKALTIMVNSGIPLHVWFLIIMNLESTLIIIIRYMVYSQNKQRENGCSLWTIENVKSVKHKRGR